MDKYPEVCIKCASGLFLYNALYETQALLSDIVDIYGGFGVGLTFVW